MVSFYKTAVAFQENFTENDYIHRKYEIGGSKSQISPAPAFVLLDFRTSFYIGFFISYFREKQSGPGLEKEQERSYTSQSSEFSQCTISPS